MASITNSLSKFLLANFHISNSKLHLKDIIIELTKKEFKIRYKHQVLGYLWSILNPLAFALIYYIVFKIIFGTRREDFPIFLISTLLPWQWVASCLGSAPSTFLSNSGLIKKTLFPRHLITFVVVFQDMIHFIISIPVIFAFTIWYNIIPGPIWLIGIPLLLFSQFLLVYGLSLLISTINIFFRDMNNIVNILIQFLFFLSPILWEINQLPAKYSKLIFVHPFASLLICWRNLFLKNEINLKFLLISLIQAIALTVLAQFCFKKLQWKFAEVL